MNTPLPTFPGTVSTDSVKISWAEYASLRSRADAVPMLVDAIKEYFAALKAADENFNARFATAEWAERDARIAACGDRIVAARAAIDSAIAQATPLLVDSEKPFGLPGAVPSNTDVRATDSPQQVRRFRCIDGFQCDTAHLERRTDGLIWRVTNDGFEELAPNYSLRDCERYVEQGQWTELEVDPPITTKSI